MTENQSEAEQVLVVDYDAVRQHHPFDKVYVAKSEVRSIVLQGNPQFIPRAEAEEAIGKYVQLIPYILIPVAPSGDRSELRLYNYRRNSAGGETRLYERRSVGLGGHINPCDRPPADELPSHDSEHVWALSTLGHAAAREISEELPLGQFGTDYTLLPFGGLYLEDTPVNAVHYGVVYVALLSSPVLDAVEERLLARHEASHSDPQLTPLETLLQPENFQSYETWSKVCLQLYSKLVSERPGIHWTSPLNPDPSAGTLP